MSCFKVLIDFYHQEAEWNLTQSAHNTDKLHVKDPTVFRQIIASSHFHSCWNLLEYRNSTVFMLTENVLLYASTCYIVNCTQKPDSKLFFLKPSSYFLYSGVFVKQFPHNFVSCNSAESSSSIFISLCNIVSFNSVQRHRKKKIKHFSRVQFYPFFTTLHVQTCLE